MTELNASSLVNLRGGTVNGRFIEPVFVCEMLEKWHCLEVKDHGINVMPRPSVPEV